MDKSRGSVWFMPAIAAVILSLTALIAGCGVESDGAPSIGAAPSVLPAVAGPVDEADGAPYMSAPGADLDALLTRYDYERIEYALSGESGLGPFETRLVIIRPQDPAEFSGVLVAELFQSSVWVQVREYLLRSGHAWAQISTRGGSWLDLLERAGPDRYASFTLPDDEVNADILAQTLALLRADDATNPLAQSPPQLVILAGYSGDAAALRGIIKRRHPGAGALLESGLIDGYFVAGTAVGAAPHVLPDIDRPVLEIMNENEMLRSFDRSGAPLAYRRPDGREYRLYEIPGAGHISTRGRSDDDPAFADCVERPLSQLPMDHLYSNAMHALVRWAGEDVPPPQAERIQFTPEGTPYKDEHGNTVGGVRFTYVDVPLASYHPISTRADDATGRTRCEMIAHAKPLDAQTLDRLYGDAEGYRARVAERLQALVAGGWYLAEDAAAIEAEARAVRWGNDASGED